jgi:hypothetical protein
MPLAPEPEPAPMPTPQPKPAAPAAPLPAPDMPGPEAQGPKAPAPAAGDAEPALAPAAAPAMPPVPAFVPSGPLEELLYTPPGKCPGGTIEYVPAGKHEAQLKPPVGAVETYGDLVGSNGKFDMPYTEVPVGGAYCTKVGSTAEKVVIGGMFLWEAAGGMCVPPPTDAAGKPCCEVFMWQPNSVGYYYDNCSMKCARPSSVCSCRACASPARPLHAYVPSAYCAL